MKFVRIHSCRNCYYCTGASLFRQPWSSITLKESKHFSFLAKKRKSIGGNPQLNWGACTVVSVVSAVAEDNTTITESRSRWLPWDGCNICYSANAVCVLLSFSSSPLLSLSFSLGIFPLMIMTVTFLFEGWRFETSPVKSPFQSNISSDLSLQSSVLTCLSCCSLFCNQSLSLWNVSLYNNKEYRYMEI